MSRYTSYEHDKIDYYKHRIRELRYLEREFAIVRDDLREVEANLRKVPSPQVKQTYKSKYEYKNNCALWNKLIMKKEELTIREMNISNAIGSIHKILDALTPVTRDLAIDLLVNKISANLAMRRYNTTNAYQTINDELKYIEIDSF